MLKEVIDRVEARVDQAAKAGIPSAAIASVDLLELCKAAKLMIEAHSAADSGEIDGIDLAWVVAADELILAKSS